MGVEYLKPDKGNLYNTIVVSEKMVKENSLLKILESPLFKESKMKIPVAMGYDITGEMVISDLKDFTHTFVGGSTNSGKSTALNNILLSIVSKQSIDDVNLLIFDFGITYLSQFRNIPHLSHPIIYDMEVGRKVIQLLYEEAEKRRVLYHKNPDDRSEFYKLPTIFCVIDEFHRFIDDGDKDKRNKLVETVRQLLNTARGLNIFMILVAQDPTEKNTKIGVTNIETILAFKCGRVHNSRTMIGESGAEKLLGKGDMLLKSAKHEGLKNIQAAYMEEKDIAKYIAGLSYLGTGESQLRKNPVLQ